MSLPKLEIKDTDEIQYSDDLKKHIEKLIDYVQEFEKVLSVTLESLTSDNVTELDFNVTRLLKLDVFNYKLANKINEQDIRNGLATEEWVTANFTQL